MWIWACRGQTSHSSLKYQSNDSSTRLWWTREQTVLLGCLASDAESCFPEICFLEEEAFVKHSCALHIYQIKIKLKHSILIKIKQRCKLSKTQIKRLSILQHWKQHKMTPWGSLLILKLLDIRAGFQESYGSEFTLFPFHRQTRKALRFKVSQFSRPWQDLSFLDKYKKHIKKPFDAAAVGMDLSKSLIISDI